MKVDSSQDATPPLARSAHATAAISGVATADAPHEWSQMRVHELFAGHFEAYQTPLVRRLFANCGIETRRFALAEDKFRPNASPAELHKLFKTHAPKLAATAARRALIAAQIDASEIGFVVAATCTGYLCPGLSVSLAHDLDLGEHVQRADLVGMGCAGAMPAIQRAFDHVRGEPTRKALVVAAEICSACWFVDDSLETVVGNAICADGAAALILEGRTPAAEEPPHGQSNSSPEILGFESVINTDWRDAVGLETVSGQHRIILSKEIRHAAGPAVRKVVDRLLERFGLKQQDISHWVFHAGGATVLSNIEDEMQFVEGELSASRSVFRRHGNMSSPTTLYVLDEIQRTTAPQPGEFGIALALGPGLATEGALLRW